MEKWSITYTKDLSLKGKFLTESFSNISTNSYTEFRNTNGEICRLGKNSTFSLEDTVLGKRPVVGGEVYLKVNPAVLGPKYRTSCWGIVINHSFMESFYKQINEQTNHIYALKGTQVIYEYDENNKAFIIASIEEGQKAILNISKTEDIRLRYKAKIDEITDTEYEYILNNYIDNRKWNNL